MPAKSCGPQPSCRYGVHGLDPADYDCAGSNAEPRRQRKPGRTSDHDGVRSQTLPFQRMARLSRLPYATKQSTIDMIALSIRSGGANGGDERLSLRSRRRPSPRPTHSAPQARIAATLISSLVELKSAVEFRLICVPRPQNTAWRATTTDSRLRVISTDVCYFGYLVEWVKHLRASGKLHLEIVRPSDRAKHFEVLAKRWTVERTVCLLSKSPRLCGDHDVQRIESIARH